MTLPPEQVPTGLTERDYRRLHLLYMTMGRSKEASLCLQYACPTNVDEAESSADSDPNTADLRGMQAGQKFAEIFLGLAMKASEQTDASQMKKDIDIAMGELQSEFASMGMTKEEIEQASGQMRQILDMAASPKLAPPREVPEGLSAEEYYDLGVRYKDAGWTEQARDALSLAIEQKDDCWSRKAEIFLRSRLPFHPVPLFAEQGNIQAFNYMVSEQTEQAYNEFFHLIQEYPDFEWPYGNLGSMYIKDGKLLAAKDCLRKAISINPYYVNAWHHLHRVFVLESDFDEARHCLSEIEKLVPDDETLEFSRKIISELEALSE